MIEAFGLAALTVGAGVYTVLAMGPANGSELKGIAIMLGLLVAFASMIGSVVAVVLARQVRRGWSPALPVATVLHVIVAVIALRAR